jgi:hypothetical protein
MTKNIKIKLLVLVLLLATSSCKKWLDLKPQDGIVREEFWNTKEQLQSAVIGCYASMLTGTLVQNMFLYGELRADMLVATNFTFTSEIDIMNADIQSTNTMANWASLYSTINYCNTVIEYGPKVLESDGTLSQEQLDAYLAEAKGLRAYLYFNLLKVWGEVPLQLKASSSDSKIEQLPKSSKQEVYDQIVSDLEFAAKHAKNTYGNQDMDKGRLTRYSIYALQADVYLWDEKYAECIAACDKIIASNKFGLIDGKNPSSWFFNVYSKGNSNESIFELQFDQQALNPWFNLLGNTGRRFTASPLIVPDEIFIVDGVNPDNKDIRGDGGSFRASDGVIAKHVVSTHGGEGFLAETSSYRHWFVYRYADVLLLKAEALAWSNKGQEALSLVETIRTRANAVESTLESPDPTIAADVSDYILRERAREFAFEGKRWFDLLRHSKRNNYARINIITDVISKIARPDKQQSMITKYKDPRSHYLPIHISELQADKLLVQNPFYN